MEKCTLEKQGFMADWFPGTIAPEKAVIVVGGSSCDENTCVAMSGYLRRAGYNVLVLGYYLWEGLPKQLIGIPIDYVEKAVAWLRAEQHIERIAMTGASTGAAYTLLAAARIPQISCVVPVVPYDYVGEGTGQSRKGYDAAGHSQYTWHGEDVPYTHSDGRIDMMAWLKGARKTPGYGLARFMRYAYDTAMEAAKTPEARIRVEDMHADVLFLAVEDDDCWPSDVAVPRMVAHLEEAGYPYRVESHIYERASHALTDGVDQMRGFAKWTVKHLLVAEKRYPRECEEARQDSFRRILTFLDEW